MANDGRLQVRGGLREDGGPGFNFDDAVTVLPPVFEHHGRAELPMLRGAEVPPYFVVQKTAEEIKDGVDAVLNVAEIMHRVVERLTANCKRVLRDPKFSREDVTHGLESGSLRYILQEELIAALEQHGGAGLGITGGGDCGGISDCVRAFAENLDSDLVPLGVKNAGKGLMVSPDKFAGELIILDNLLVKDMRGKSSTPFGSTRLNPFVDGSIENTLANIGEFGFVYGTGGNGNIAAFERMAQAFPDKVLVVAPKSIDGDVMVDGQPLQMIGFDTAMRKCQADIYANAQSASAHDHVIVMEIFGRQCGLLPFGAGRSDPKNLEELRADPATVDLACKIEELGDTVMILVPEKPTSLLSIAKEVKWRKKEHGSCVVAMSEGFVPPEVRKWAETLYEFVQAEREEGREVSREQLLSKIEAGDNEEDMLLKEILKDGELAEHFMKLVLGRERGDDGKPKVPLMRLRKFVMAAIKKAGEIDKVGEAMQTYDLRGATPSEYDRIMAQKIGEVMAWVVNEGIAGGRVVAYLPDMDPRVDGPVILSLTDVSDQNTLANKRLYPGKMLRQSGVFWDNGKKAA